jgi:hypothetical protein
VRRECILRHPWHPRLRRHQDFELLARLANHIAIASKPGITVNVDWTSTPRRHKAHSDCFSVLHEFKPRLRDGLYRRHFFFLFNSARESNDYSWLLQIVEFILLSLSPMLRPFRRINYWLSA